MTTRTLTIAGFTLSIVLVISTGLLLWLSTSHASHTRSSNDTPAFVQPVYSYGIQPPKFFDQAYKNIQQTHRTNAQSAIVAHHLLVADKIAEVFESLASPRVDTVVLLSPNHFSTGQSAAQVSRGQWETPYGMVNTDRRAIEKLVQQAPDLQYEELAFSGEHGIGALTPFVKRSFPNAKIVPIILDESLDPQSAQTLGRIIAEQLPRAVVIASIDMSHNLPLHTSEFHDEVTIHAIEQGRTSTDLEIDANAALRTLMSVNATRGTEQFTLTHHNSSLGMEGTADWRENTSHILGYFERGDAEDAQMATFHFVGDIMLDRGVRRQILEHDDVSYPWKEMTRFLRGVDLRVGNLEGTVNEQPSTYTYNPPFRFVFDPSYVEAMKPFIDVVSLANNHAADVIGGEAETRRWLKELQIPSFGGWDSPTPRHDFTIDGIDITLIGYHQFRPAVDELVETIQSARDRFVIVMPHWGAEYITAPSSSQRELAQIMIDAGADLIVGGHPHVAQGIEVIDGVPVLYSLGNFVFDQEIPSTWEALTAGVIIEEQSIRIHLLPVWTRYGQPTPLDDVRAQQLFNTIAEYSSPTLRNHIHSGTITLSL